MLLLRRMVARSSAQRSMMWYAVLLWSLGSVRVLTKWASEQSDSFVERTPPFIPVVVRIHVDTRELELRIDAMIDTGFDGELILPMRLQDEFGQPKLDAIWYLAARSPVEIPSYNAEVQRPGLAHAKTLLSAASDRARS
jgi:predicted aspartyl protease